MKTRIAITGATGFLGKYLVRDLQFDENVELFLYSTSVLKLRQTFPDLSRAHFIETDYSYNSLKNSFSNYHAVVHLAAKRLMPEKNDISTYWCNVEHTENLLRLSDAHQVEDFIFASSISVYDSSKNSIPFSEEDTPYPQNVYGISKLACEELSAKFKTKMVNLRLGQLIGWGERGEYMFTQSLNKMRRNEPITLWGEGGGGRDYIYTKDVVRIIIMAIEKKISGTFNVGSGRHVSFKELAEIIVGTFGNNTSTIINDKTKIEKKEIRYMNIEKVKKEYNWFPSYSFKDALSDMLLDSKKGFQ